jgi:hypothetical protein
MKFFTAILILIAAYFVAPMIIAMDETSKENNTENRLSELSKYQAPAANQINTLTGHSPP